MGWTLHRKKGPLHVDSFTNRTVWSQECFQPPRHPVAAFFHATEWMQSSLISSCTFWDDADDLDGYTNHLNRLYHLKMCTASILMCVPMRAPLTTPDWLKPLFKTVTILNLTWLQTVFGENDLMKHSFDANPYAPMHLQILTLPATSHPEHKERESLLRKHN